MTNRHNSTLSAPTKELKRSWLKRNTRLRHGNGTSFKLSADDKAQWKWMGSYAKEPHPCDGCGRFTYLSRCHLLAKSRGGRVADNIVLLCEVETSPADDTRVTNIGCHGKQEKRTEKYEAEMGVDLYAKAQAHTAQWRKETGR